MMALFGMPPVRRRPPFTWALALPLCLLPAARGYDASIDSPMYQDPDVPVPPVVIVFPEEKGLWLKALGRPEVDMRAEAAAAIARAHRRGVPGLESTVAPLRAALDQPDQHPAVVLAVAQALIALDARQAAPGLLRAARDGGTDVRELVEPVLARWHYRPARALWLGRLQEPGIARRDLVRAVRGLAEVGEDQAAGPLRRLVLAERVPAQVRLECARALGRLQADGLEGDAERLAADASPRGTAARMAAASLLLHREGGPAARVLRRLAADSEPAVIALAAGRLLEIDPQLLVGTLDRLLGNRDGRVRSVGVALLLRLPTAERLAPLADRLDDPDPGVRLQARAGLRDLAARQEFHDRVIAEATRLLAAPSWRGQEQAALLLAQLDHKPAAGRLVELLGSDRPEVYVTAAWALRKLDVPESLPRVARYIAAADIRRGRNREMIDHQLSQVNQFLGRRKYAPADPQLRRFIPKPGGMPADPESRAAAVWALGRIHEGRQVPDLVTALLGRLNDTGNPMPEREQVRGMAAVSLGRLRARGALPSLRKYYSGQGPSEDRTSNACGWAVEQLTGEKMPPAQPLKRLRRDSFLTPTN
jgi:HEAT repeat protein